MSVLANHDNINLRSKAIAAINERSKMDRKFRHIPLLKRIFWIITWRLLHVCCCCVKPAKITSKGYSRLSKELDIVRFIKR